MTLRMVVGEGAGLQTRGGGAREGWVSTSPHPLLSLITPQQSLWGKAPDRWGWGEGNLGRRLLHGVGRDC